MAGRHKLTEEEKEQRRIEKEKLFEGRTKYNRKPKQNDDQSSSSLQDNNTMENNSNNNGDQNSNQNSNVNNPVVNAGGEGQENNGNGGAGENNGAGVNSSAGQQQEKTETTNNSSSSGGGGTMYQPVKKWQPLGGDRIKRNYSTPEINQELLGKEIPEVNIGDQKVSTENAVETLNKPITENTGSGGAPVNNGNNNTPAKQEIKPIVENWNSLSPDEQKIAAAQTTDMILGVYDKLHMFGRMAIKKDHDELVEAHNEDRIDMHDTVTESEDDPEKAITIEDFWNDFNNQVEERFIVSEGFKNKVRPPMERLCMKYGLGASDGLALAFYFSEDAATKIAMLVGFRKTVAKMDEVFEKKHAKFKKAVEAEVARREAIAKAAAAKTNNGGGDNKTAKKDEVKENNSNAANNTGDNSSQNSDNKNNSNASDTKKG